MVGNAREQLFFKLCSDHLSIEAIPKTTMHIDLTKLKDRVIPGHDVMMWTPQLVVLRNKTGQEITLRKDGRMVIRRAGSEQMAHRTAAEVMRLVYYASRA
jgi:hypothetical protein